MSLWTSEALEAATGGRASRDFTVDGLSIDTRSIRQGDLFIALTAARDGHDFVAAALEAGAGAALVSRIPEGLPADAPLLLVDDVQRALEDLGRAGRARTGARVIAMTGSVGKTSAKEMLRAALSGAGAVHAAVASFNNHWGVPLTLARMPAATDIALIEIGMSNPGEIAPLAAMARPHVALITTIAPAHLEAFPDGLEGIAREKAAIFGALEPGGTAILPEGLPTSPILRAAAVAQGARVVSFGGAGDWRLEHVQATPAGQTVIEATSPAGPVLFKLRSLGRHFAGNALAVLAACAAVGADGALSALHLAEWQPPAGRGQLERIALDGADQSLDLIDDAFNANPASMSASFEVLAQMTPRDGLGQIRKGRRIAILGDMLELGPDEMQAHADLADHPAMAAIDLVHCAGPRMFRLWNALPEPKRGLWVQSADDLAHGVKNLVDPGDIVLIKGSKSSKISRVVDALRKLGQPVPSSEGIS